MGTTTSGRLLADRRGWPFFDLDEEIERHYETSIERLQARFLTGYSYRKECAGVLERITFYDIDSRLIEKHLTDDERRLQLTAIKADISYFRKSYERANLQVTIAGLDPQASAAAIDAQLGPT